MGRFKLSTRVQHLNESATLRMAQMARELSNRQIDVINLSLGEPDFDTPMHIKEKAKEAIDSGNTKYTPVAGTLALRQAISDKFKRDNQLNYSTDEIIVSNGAKQSFANLCNAMLDNPLDEVVLLAPYWVSYYEIIRLAGGTPIVVHSNVANNYKPRPEELKAALSANTRMLVFSSPCNPTGTLFNQQDCMEIANLLKEYPDVLVVSDEIYEYIVFDQKHFSIGSIEGMNERTATINGFSKGFSMTGWRLGYMGAPKEITQACIRIQGQYTSGASSFTQAAGAFALTSDLSITRKMCEAFKSRRNTLIRELSRITEWTINIPDGAFYLLPDVSKTFGKKHNGNTIYNSEDLAIYLLNEAHVALVAGDAFGAPNCIRISYSLSEEKVIEAVQRIEAALQKLS